MSVPARFLTAALPALALSLGTGSCASTAARASWASQASGAADDVAPVTPVDSGAPTPVGGDRDMGFEGTGFIAYDNDIFAGNDDRYSSGLSIGWVTTDVSELSGGNWLRRFGEFASFLPAVGAAGRATHVAFRFGQEIYNPESLHLVTPPPEEHPYAGVLALDTQIYTRSERSMHAYSLRLGIVGPSALGEQMQESAHSFVNGLTPRGWENQLSDEPIINLDYAGYRRLARDVHERDLGTDLTLHGGAGLGTYYIGADAGLTGRLGWGIPESFGFSGNSRSQHALAGYRPERGLRAWVFVDLGGRAVGRFLPTDGLAFEDSPSGERDSLFFTGTGGLTVAWQRLRLTFSYEAVVGSGDVGDGHQREDDVGSVRLAWSF